MNGESGSERADLAFLAEDVKRQRRIAREIMADSEAIGRLLDSDTSALGSDEVNFLKRMREQLQARAEDLSDNANDTASREPRPRRAAAARPAPDAAPAAQTSAAALQTAPAAQASAAEHGGRAAGDLARVVVVCYLMFLFAFMGYLFAKSHLMRADVTGDIIEMFKVFLLPVVTLVLGFFFGSSRR